MPRNGRVQFQAVSREPGQVKAGTEIGLEDGPGGTISEFE